MELKGSRRIAADRQAVWEALNDPEVLQACIPGCQELTGSPENGFDAVVKQKVGPVSATFKGAVSLSNVVPGESYTISGEGKGGAAGFAKGGADVRLEDAEGGGTLLGYEVKASVGGKLAQLGSRVIDGFSKKMADQFFENFQREVEGPEAAAAEKVAGHVDGQVDGEVAGEARTAQEAQAAPRPAPAPDVPAASAAPVPDPGAPAGASAAPGAPAGGSASPQAAAPKPGAPRQGPAAPPSSARPGPVPAAGSAPGLGARIAAWFRRVFGRG